MTWLSPTAIGQGAWALRHVLFVLSLRVLPFAILAVFSRRIPPPTRAIAVGGYLLLALALYLWSYGPLLAAVVLGFVYYSAVACAVYCLPPLVARGAIGGGTLFFGLVSTYLLVPSLFFHAYTSITILILGWDLVLSSYSYCVDVAHDARRPQLSDCLLFLLVNPTLVFCERGQPAVEPCRFRIGFGRALVGGLLLFAVSAVLRPMYHVALTRAPELGFVSATASGFFVFGVLRLLSEYAAHSGLANIQIGLMRQIGYQVPERYRYPLASRSPADFWTRWNTYVGTWIRYYVFVPVARNRRRHTRPWLAGAIAIGVSLLVCGVLHDAYTYIAAFTVTTRFIQFFSSAALAGLMWSLASLVMRRVQRTVTPSRGATLQRYAAFTSRLCTLFALIAAASFWGANP